MYAFQEGDLAKVMALPIPFRKWLIERWNKQKEAEHKAKSSETDVNQPLSESERMKYIVNKQVDTFKHPSQNQALMQGVRNKK
jgi:pantothenate kinase